MTVAQIRQVYQKGELHREDLAPDPILQFGRWMEEAVAARLPDPTAMTLSSADADGRVFARTVLLKGYDARGFLFYTNHESRKARQFAANPHAALTFYWPALERQVCVAGRIEKLPHQESELYFRTRPRENQLGAWVSAQSQVIPDRDLLEQKLAQVAAEYEGREIPMPPFWGGYLVRPAEIEFWQGRPSRLHDRFRFRSVEGKWLIERLSP